MTTETLSSYGTPITWDEETRTMRCGNLVARDYTVFKMAVRKMRDGLSTRHSTWKHFAERVLGYNNYSKCLGGGGQFNKNLAIALGGAAPKVLCDKWNYWMYKKWIQPQKEILNIVARGKRGRFIPEKVTNLWDDHHFGDSDKTLLKICQEAINVNHSNLVPLVFVSGWDINILRKELGDSYFQFATNTISRNKLFAQNVQPFLWKSYVSLSSSTIKNLSERNNVFPTKVRDQIGYKPYAEILKAVDKAGRKSKILNKRDKIYMAFCVIYSVSGGKNFDGSENWNATDWEAQVDPIKKPSVLEVEKIVHDIATINGHSVVKRYHSHNLFERYSFACPSCGNTLLSGGTTCNPIIPSHPAFYPCGTAWNNLGSGWPSMSDEVGKLIMDLQARARGDA